MNNTYRIFNEGNENESVPKNKILIFEGKFEYFLTDDNVGAAFSLMKNFIVNKLLKIIVVLCINFVKTIFNSKNHKYSECTPQK